MNETEVIRLLRDYAAQYNDWKYFTGDPIIFPKHFAGLMAEGRATLQDVEVAAAVAAHLAWGRREMIVRDCRRAMDEMGWQPYEYVMAGKYRSDSTSLHRTVKWSEFAGICGRLREFYRDNESLEVLHPGTDARPRLRAEGRPFGSQQEDPHAEAVDGPGRRKGGHRAVEGHRQAGAYHSVRRACAPECGEFGYNCTSLRGYQDCRRDNPLPAESVPGGPCTGRFCSFRSGGIGWLLKTFSQFMPDFR